MVLNVFNVHKKSPWRAQQELNLQPFESESNALSVELWAHYLPVEPKPPCLFEFISSAAHTGWCDFLRTV